jgi:hypothetical protein
MVMTFVVLRRLIPHSPRAMLATLVALPPLQLALGAPWTARALGALVGGGGDVSAVCGGLGAGVWGGGARNLAFQGSRLHFGPSQPAITHKSVCAHLLSIRCRRIFVDKISFIQ